MDTEAVMEPRKRQGDAADEVTRYISQLIALNRLQPGEKLPSVRELAHTTGFSQPIVLQALKRLQADGRVNTRRGGGSWVAPLDADNVDVRRFRLWERRDEILQMCVLREILEVGVARRLAERGLSKERIATAQELLAEMRTLTKRDVEHYQRLDTEFHAILAGGLNMPLISTELVEARAAVTQTFEFLSWPTDRWATNDVEHLDLLQAIIDRDPDAAAKAAGQHIASVGPLVERLLVGDGAKFLTRQMTFPAAQRRS